jgi:hypothetical protein
MSSDDDWMVSQVGVAAWSARLRRVTSFEILSYADSARIFRHSKPSQDRRRDAPPQSLEFVRPEDFSEILRVQPVLDRRVNLRPESAGLHGPAIHQTPDEIQAARLEMLLHRSSRSFNSRYVSSSAWLMVSGGAMGGTSGAPTRPGAGTRPWSAKQTRVRGVGPNSMRGQVS